MQYSPLLPPAKKLRQGNVFTPVCHSVLPPLGRHPLPSACWIHPPAQCMLGYSQQAGGTHPIGIHSCLVYSLRLINLRCEWTLKDPTQIYASVPITRQISTDVNLHYIFPSLKALFSLVFSICHSNDFPLSHFSLEVARSHTVLQKGKMSLGQVHSSCYSHRMT